MAARHGSALSMAWTRDSTQLGIGCADGQVVFAHIANRSVSHQNWHCRINNRNQIIMHNILSPDFESVYDTLEFAESVIAFALDYEYLVVATTQQCYVYQVEAVSTPQMVALTPKTVIYAILQTPSFFVLVSNVSGLQVVGYDGRTLCQIESKTLSPHLLNTHNASAENDCIAVLDVLCPKRIHLYDPYTARTLSDSVEHGVGCSTAFKLGR